MNWLSFANPWFLAGLAAIGLPVLIHYLTRARPRRVAFPPFKFLAEACAGQQALNRLRRFILLALRCLAVAALALLFSRPFLKPTGAAAQTEAGKRVVLLIDASLSMRAVQQGVPLFNRAKAEAAEALRSLEPNSEAAVILAGMVPRPLLPALSRNLPALHEELVKAQPTFESADFNAALVLARRLLGGSGTVYIFSDFQKSNWEAASELPAGLFCRIRPVTTTPVDNVGLVRARILPEQPVAGETGEAVCTVFNCTPRPREETVRLQLGEFSQEKRVTVAPFATADALFNVTFPQAGTFTGKCWLNADDLREDDTRYLSVHARKSLKLLLVSDADAADQRSAAFFVSRALVPSAQSAPGLSLTRRHSQDTDRGALETSDIFILVAPAQPSGEAVEIISRRVKEGARLVIVLDGPTALSLAVPAFNPPFQLQRSILSESGGSLRPGLRPLFPDVDAAEWSNVRFRRHYQTQLLEDRAGDVMLAYDDGSSALTYSSFGKGVVVYANLPLSPEGGDFVGSPMFPATLHEILRALRRGSEMAPVTPGMSWVLETETAGSLPVTVRDPEGNSVEVQLLSSGRSSRLALPAAGVPGVYVARQGEATVGGEAVNVDARESDTRPIALEQLKAGQGTSITVARNEEELLISGKARPLWPQLAAAAVCLLGLEMLLLALWRPGKVRATPEPVLTRAAAGVKS